MEKCSSILVAVTDAASSEVLLAKATTIAWRCGARLELLLDEHAAAHAIAKRMSAAGLDDRVSYSLHEPRETLNDAIARHAGEHRSDLVMKCAGSPATLRRLLRPEEDIALAGRLRVPLLRVGAIAWNADVRFAATIDASDRDSDAVARSILHAAGLMAMRCEATLDVLYAEREAHDERLRMERAVRVARLVREFHVGGERLRVLNGPPARTLPAAIAAEAYDVVVVGALSRRPATLPWTHSLTTQLANAGAGDVMFVPETERAAIDVIERRSAEPTPHAVHP